MQFQVSAHQYHKINFNIERQIIKGCICFTKECSAIGRQNFGYLPNQSNAKEKQSHFLICTQALIIGAPGRSFLCVREDLRRVEQRFAGGVGTNSIIVPDPLQTSVQLALLKLSHFPAGEETLVPKRSTKPQPILRN